MPQKLTISFDDSQIAFQSKSNFDLWKTYFLFSSMKKPWMVKFGTFSTALALKLMLPVKGIIKKTIFHQFCGGESIHDSAETIQHLGNFNVKTILDYSVEGQEEESSFDRTKDEALRVAEFAKDNPYIPFCVVKMTGLGSRSLMEKVQKQDELDEIELNQFENIKKRVDEIAAYIAKNNLKFLIDAEESWIQDVIDEICLDLMIRYNKKRFVVYNTYQFYRHEALANMKKGFERVTGSGSLFAAKFVRGAYMEKERDRAEELNYPDPIHADKPSTDKDYNTAQQYTIDHIDKFAVCAGTHNEYSCALLASLVTERGLAKDDERIYFAQLLGMSDNISFKLSSEGYNVAKYVPYGPVREVLPYLFRRAEENTSIAGQSSREYMLVKRELKRRRSE